MMHLHRFGDAVRTAGACGWYIEARLKEAIAERGSATLAISGGSAPKPMFALFGRDGFDWSRVHLFWVDERVVPPTDSQSNYKLAADAWLNAVKFPAANIHRVRTELGAEAAAEQYTAEIRAYFSASTAPAGSLAASGIPVFDVIHRGMGPDGHSASLFPGEALIDDHGGIAAAVWVEKMHQWRVTLLPGVLESARRTVMLVTGADKTAMLRIVLQGGFDPKRYPVQIGIKEDSEWYVDEAAAGAMPVFS